MKIIYPENIINFIAQTDLTFVNEIVAIGKVKQTVSGVKYIVIEE